MSNLNLIVQLIQDIGMVHVRKVLVVLVAVTARTVEEDVLTKV